MTGSDAIILAVEDEPRNAALLRAILGPAGFELHVADSLQAGRAWLADNDPDLVLLDRHLPDGDGLDLVPEIRAAAGDRNCRILLVSASVLPADRLAAEQAGCDGFIAKPVRVQELLGVIREQLGGRRVGRTA